MDPFTVIILGGTVGLLIALLLLGLMAPGNGSRQLDWRPTRTAEQEAEMEADDLEQMLAAANRRRRRQGRPEVTADSLSADLARERAALAGGDQEDEQMAEEEIRQMVERKNARRRRKGLPELTVEEERERLRREGLA
ncbi:hypothetical protein [Conexibacter sp. SYSU D00693]|uniref:hypothetical protein n=1 Tax=Conexibacter sp. SYSU D00693 TaxID=2812560 RepID=UPI00196AAB30|nr:hypothetical protein [Conexibacter sp. SYSU D00693]